MRGCDNDSRHRSKLFSPISAGCQRSPLTKSSTAAVPRPLLRVAVALRVRPHLPFECLRSWLLFKAPCMLCICLSSMACPNCYFDGPDWDILIIMGREMWWLKLEDSCPWGLRISARNHHYVVVLSSLNWEWIWTIPSRHLFFIFGFPYCFLRIMASQCWVQETHAK